MFLWRSASSWFISSSRRKESIFTMPVADALCGRMKPTPRMVCMGPSLVHPSLCRSEERWTSSVPVS